MNRTVKVVLSIAVLGVAGAGMGLWWFFSDDAPDEVSLDAAAAGVTSTPVADGTTDDVGTTVEDIAGTWTVDTDSGDFDYESATGTFVGFRIEENLANIGSSTAVGRTGDISGVMVIDGTTVTDASFEIGLTTITTNDSRRDGKVQVALETDQFSAATFDLTDPIQLGDAASGGNPVIVNAVGELTLHGVTKPVTFELEAKVVGSAVVVVGSTEITFADYGVEVPSSPAVLSVEDTGTLELQLLLVQV